MFLFHNIASSLQNQSAENAADPRNDCSTTNTESVSSDRVPKGQEYYPVNNSTIETFNYITGSRRLFFRLQFTLER